MLLSRLLGEVGRRVTTILAVGELLLQTEKLIREIFGYYYVSIGLIEGGELAITTEEPCDRPRLKIGEEGIMGWVAATGKPALIPDVSREPRYIATVASTRTHSELALPITWKDNIVGVLNIESDQLDAFDASDVAVLQSLADQLAVAIENARLFEAEQRRAEQFRVIAELGHRITSLLPLDELLNQTAHLIRETFGYHHIHIGLIEKGQVIFKASAGVWKDEPDCQCCSGLAIHVGRTGISGWVAATGEPYLAPDVTRDPHFVALESSQAGSELVMPLIVKGKVIGVLDVESERTNGFELNDVTVLQALATQVAAAIENARLYEQSQQLAALEERQRLARELHDSVSQALYGIALGARTARALLDRDPSKLAEPLDYVLSLAEAGLAEMRALIFELRPESLEMEGLVAALTKQANSLRARYHLEVHTAFGNEPSAPPAVKEALYRIAQEALRNAVKHAQAKRVSVRLGDESGDLILEISDDGIGFDPDSGYPGHLGLRSMRERAERLGGVLEVDSAPMRGASIRIKVKQVSA